MLSYVGKTDHVKQKQANSYSSDMFSVKRSVYFPRITAPWRKLQHKLPLFKPEGSGFFYIIDATRHFFLTISCIYWQFPVPYAGKLFTCQVKICKNSFLCFVFRQKALLSLLWPCSLGAPWPGAGKNNWQNGMAECLKVFERSKRPAGRAKGPCLRAGGTGRNATGPRTPAPAAPEDAATVAQGLCRPCSNACSR